MVKKYVYLDLSIFFFLTISFLTISYHGQIAGVNTLIWEREEILNATQQSLLKKRVEESRGRAGTSRARGQQQRPPRERRGNAEDLKLKKKLASLESTETKSKTERNKKK